MMKLLKSLFFYCFSITTLHGQSASTMAYFFTQADVLLRQAVQGDRVHYKLLDLARLTDLLEYAEAASLEGLGEDEKKAFYINTYNLQVLQGVVDDYPISSVQKISNFFDRKEHQILGRQYSLNSFEKELLNLYPDPRLHFALSCGALGCPPLADYAFLPSQLDQQLDERTRDALNDPNFLRVDGEKIFLSQIFRWYSSDFGGSLEQILSFINQYRDEKVGSQVNVDYYPYDWMLNDAVLDVGNNSARYVVSSVRPRGTVEAKWFNNLYTQQVPSNGRQESYFTSQFGFLYGLTDRTNIGFDVRQRYVAFHPEPSGAFDAFSSTPLQSRSAIATVGPKVRIAPNPKWPNMSIQSAVWFPIVDELEGGEELPWLDWSSPTWFTQIWNDFSIGHSYAFFLELDLFWEDIGFGKEEATNRFVSPVTGILSYFPTSKSTLYGLVNFAPIWTPQADYWSQIGAGAKYQIHRNFEVELLYTYFFNQYLIEQTGRASTFNIGFRYSN